ncbi:MAG: hypothetical protein H6719_08640 [Sandaracinaceae bacterium]|nr:hypothetical protein [Sandaracinaceae bacterium]
MGGFLQDLQTHGVGVMIVIGVVFAALVVIQWLMWIFGVGRFREKPKPLDAQKSAVRYVLTELFVRIITEFRHFLALVIVLVFAFALATAMYPGLAAGDVSKIVDGVQAVSAVLGGLLGSIIGYYFGESAARSKTDPPADDELTDGSLVQGDLPSDVDRPRPAPPILEAPLPAALAGDDDEEEPT